MTKYFFLSRLLPATCFSPPSFLPYEECLNLICILPVLGKRRGEDLHSEQIRFGHIFRARKPNSRVSVK